MTYLTVEDIQERYKVGRDKAYRIMKNVRKQFNGGFLQSANRILLSELEWCEQHPQPNYNERI